MFAMCMDLREEKHRVKWNGSAVLIGDNLCHQLHKELNRKGAVAMLSEFTRCGL